jgi:HSP20 family protein
MAITRWDPFAEIMTMERNLDRLFSRLVVPPLPVSDLESSVWMPTTDIVTRGEDLVVRAELPGVEPENVDISVTDGVLVLKGERTSEESRHDTGYVMRESFHGSFERRLTLPEGTDPASITARVEHGVLEVVVPGAAAVPASSTHHIPLVAAGESTSVTTGPSPLEAGSESGGETT